MRTHFGELVYMPLIRHGSRRATFPRGEGFEVYYTVFSDFPQALRGVISAQINVLTECPYIDIIL